MDYHKQQFKAFEKNCTKHEGPLNKYKYSAEYSSKTDTKKNFLHEIQNKTINKREEKKKTQRKVLAPPMDYAELLERAAYNVAQLGDRKFKLPERLMTQKEKESLGLGGQPPKNVRDANEKREVKIVEERTVTENEKFHRTEEIEKLDKLKNNYDTKSKKIENEFHKACEEKKSTGKLVVILSRVSGSEEWELKHHSVLDENLSKEVSRIATGRSEECLESSGRHKINSASFSTETRMLKEQSEPTLTTKSNDITTAERNCLKQVSVKSEFNLTSSFTTYKGSRNISATKSSLPKYGEKRKKVCLANDRDSNSKRSRTTDDKKTKKTLDYRVHNGFSSESSVVFNEKTSFERKITAIEKSESRNNGTDTDSTPNNFNKKSVFNYKILNKERELSQESSNSFESNSDNSANGHESELTSSSPSSTSTDSHSCSSSCSYSESETNETITYSPNDFLSQATNFIKILSPLPVEKNISNPDNIYQYACPEKQKVTFDKEAYIFQYKELNLSEPSSDEMEIINETSSLQHVESNIHPSPLDILPNTSNIHPSPLDIVPNTSNSKDFSNEVKGNNGTNERSSPLNDNEVKQETRTKGGKNVLMKTLSSLQKKYSGTSYDIKTFFRYDAEEADPLNIIRNNKGRNGLLRTDLFLSDSDQ